MTITEDPFEQQRRHPLATKKFNLFLSSSHKTLYSVNYVFSFRPMISKRGEADNQSLRTVSVTLPCCALIWGCHLLISIDEYNNSPDIANSKSSTTHHQASDANSVNHDEGTLPFKLLFEIFLREGQSTYHGKWSCLSVTAIWRVNF